MAFKLNFILTKNCVYYHIVIVLLIAFVSINNCLCSTRNCTVYLIGSYIAHSLLYIRLLY